MSLSFLLLLFSFSLPLAHAQQTPISLVCGRGVEELLDAKVERPPPRNLNEERVNLDKDVISPALYLTHRVGEYGDYQCCWEDIVIMRKRSRREKSGA
ncbi:hypothetical protein C8J56DRAFT_272572 [Mycena floridula]|nr:hypothetical protein C8J56DRAFT_272572 [Mycena floridula]